MKFQQSKKQLYLLTTHELSKSIARRQNLFIKIVQPVDALNDGVRVTGEPDSSEKKVNL